MERTHMRKFITAALLSLIIALTFSSCIYLEDIRPKNSEAEDKSNTESSLLTQSDESNASVGDESVDASSPSSEESSAEESSGEVSEDTPLQSYDYNGFSITGFKTSEITTLISDLTSIISDTGVNISIYYEELDTGYSISYNKDKKYCSGSVIKAPYAMYLMSSNIDLTQKLTLQSSQKMDGSGVIKDSAAGTDYTIEKLIEYSIINSDNTAYRMLYAVLSLLIMEYSISFSMV